MYIEVDYCPTSKRKHYFISVGLNEKEAISFDNTTKGHRVIKQVLVKKETPEKAVEEYGDVTAEWDTIVIENGKFLRKYHTKWIDRGKFDMVNGETWETVWEKSIPPEVDEKLLYYSRLILDNYERLDEYAKEMGEFEEFVRKEVEKC